MYVTFGYMYVLPVNIFLCLLLLSSSLPINRRSDATPNTLAASLLLRKKRKIKKETEREKDKNISSNNGKTKCFREKISYHI